MKCPSTLTLASRVSQISIWLSFVGDTADVAGIFEFTICKLLSIGCRKKSRQYWGNCNSYNTKWFTDVTSINYFHWQIMESRGVKLAQWDVISTTLNVDAVSWSSCKADNEWCCILLISAPSNALNWWIHFYHLNDKWLDLIWLALYDCHQ